MAVTIDDIASQYICQYKTMTVSKTVSGTNRTLLAFIGYRNDIVTPQTATFDGNIMTLLGTETISDMSLKVYYLARPPKGTHDFVLTCTGIDSSWGAIVLVSCNGSSGVVDGFGSDTFNAGDPTKDIVSAANNLVFDMFMGYGFTADPTVGAGQTQRALDTPNGIGAQARMGVSTEPGAASVTMSWAGAGGSRYGSHAGINVVAGTQSSDSGGLSALGVG